MEHTKYVAFTFDDGPVSCKEGATSMRILHTLKTYGQQATFFYVGEQINEETAVEMQFAQSIGCEAGNHSFTHGHMEGRTTEQIKEEFFMCAEAVKKAVGKTPTLARVPYLEMNATIAAAVEYPMLRCSVDSRDWAKAPTDEIIRRIMEAEEKGALENAVVLMHEQFETTAEAVEYILPLLLEKGYRFVTVSELARQNEIEMQKHKEYERLQ